MTTRQSKILAYRYVYSFASLIASSEDEDRLVEMTDDPQEREMIRLQAERLRDRLRKDIHWTLDELDDTDKWYCQGRIQ